MARIGIPGIHKISCVNSQKTQIFCTMIFTSVGRLQEVLNSGAYG